MVSVVPGPDPTLIAVLEPRPVFNWWSPPTPLRTRLSDRCTDESPTVSPPADTVISFGRGILIAWTESNQASIVKYAWSSDSELVTDWFVNQAWIPKNGGLFQWVSDSTSIRLNDSQRSRFYRKLASVARKNYAKVVQCNTVSARYVFISYCSFIIGFLLVWNFPLILLKHYHVTWFYKLLLFLVSKSYAWFEFEK